MLQQFHDWWRNPFNSANSAPQWFLTVGLVLVAAVLWGIIIRHLEAV